MSAAYNIDTRRSEFSATADLTGDGELIELFAFEAPENLSATSAIGLVLHDDDLVAGRDIGWRTERGLSASLERRAGERLMLAMEADALRRLLIAQRARATDKGRIVEIAFSTTVAYPRGVQASGRRRLSVLPIAGAPAPGVRGTVEEIDIDRLGAIEAVRVAEIVLALPAELSLLDEPAILIEAALEDTPAAELHVELDPLWTGAGRLEPLDAPDPSLRRMAFRISDPRAVAGQRVRLTATLGGGALADLITGRLGRTREGALTLGFKARLTGWRVGGPVQPNETTRLWRLNLPDMSVELKAAKSGTATVGIGGFSARWPLDAQSTDIEGAQELTGAYDVETPQRGLALPELDISVSGWPVGRAPGLDIEAALDLPGSDPGRLSERLVLSLGGRMADQEGRMRLSLAPLAPAVLRALAAARDPAPETRGVLRIAFAAREGGHANDLAVTLPLVLRPRPRRFDLAIDLGATGVSAWAVRSPTSGQPEGLKLAGIGAPLRDDGRPVEAADLAILPAALAREAEVGRRGLPFPLIPGGDTGVRFSGAEDGLSVSPRRRLMASAGRAAGIGRGLGAETRGPAALMADALAEAVLGRLLPLHPDWRRAEDANARLVPRIHLTHPAGLGGDMDALYRSVAAQLPARLEPFFPGARDVPDLVNLIGEGVAAARFGLSALQPPPQSDAPQHLVSIDIGATATNVAVLDAALGAARALAAFSLPIGGGAIHQALAATVASHLEALESALKSGWARTYPGDAALGPPEAEGHGRVDAAGFLMRAVERAMAGLAAAARKRADRADAAYGWPDDDDSFLAVTVARLEPNAPPRGLFVPRRVPHQGSGAVPGPSGAGELRWRVVGDATKELQFLLDRRALAAAGEASRRLEKAVAAVGGTIPRMARSAIPAGRTRPETRVFVTGRGALWPPLWEAIGETLRAMGWELALQRPLPPERMKLAVSTGAALIVAERRHADLAPTHGAPLALAVSTVRVSADEAGQTGTATATERLYYLTADAGGGRREYEAENPQQPSLTGRVNLGRRFGFVRAAPGLDPDGRTVRQLADAMGVEPLRQLDGEATLDAVEFGLPAFGPCDIWAEPSADGALHVRVASIDTGWSGEWIVRGDAVARKDGGA